jgi:hypothetical protein
VGLHAWRAAALAVLRGRTSAQIAECSRWPERANCNRACKAEVEKNSHMLAPASRWHVERTKEVPMPETINKDIDIQIPWNCRWVRVGNRFVGITEQGDGMWLCARPPSPSRYVTEEECTHCKFWEADETLES